MTRPEAVKTAVPLPPAAAWTKTWVRIPFASFIWEATVRFQISS